VWTGHPQSCSSMSDQITARRGSQHEMKYVRLYSSNFNQILKTQSSMKYSSMFTLMGLLNAFLVFILLAIMLAVYSSGIGYSPKYLWVVLGIGLIANVLLAVRFSAIQSDIEVMDAIERPNSFVNHTSLIQLTDKVYLMEDDIANDISVIRQRLANLSKDVNDLKKEK
jgi:hypothetical protein